MRAIETSHIDAIAIAFDLLAGCARGAVAVIEEGGSTPLEGRISHGLEAAVRWLEQALEPVFNAPQIEERGRA